MIKNIAALSLSILVLCPPAFATEWHSFGPRSMGMGGAGVALPQAGLSSYWNPATTGLPDVSSGGQGTVSAHATVAGSTIQGANDLHSVTQACQSSPQGPLCTSANITAALANIGQPGNGALGDAGAGANLKIKSILVFVDDFVYVGATPHTDTLNVSPNPALATFVGNNQSKLTLRGISVAEFGVGYGMELPFAKGLYVGGNAKLLSGKVGFNNYFIANNGAGDSGSLSSFTSGAKTSIQPGVDVGALWDIGKTLDFVPMHPRIGVTARNINDPKFQQPAQATLAGEPAHYSLQGQARAGVAISPFKFWNIVADADLTHNLTPVDGFLSQTIGLGTEVNVFDRTWLNIPVRVGISKNIAEPNTKTALSLGTGLNFLHVHFDVAGMASPSTESVQTQGTSTKIPGEVGVAAQLGLVFGGVN